jgi:hypothetical protein
MAGTGTIYYFEQTNPEELKPLISVFSPRGEWWFQAEAHGSLSTLRQATVPLLI